MWPQAVLSSEHCSFGSDDEIEPTAVVHSFGRGEFWDLTEKAKIPSVLLEELCQHEQSEKDSQVSTWSGKVGVSVRSKVRETMTCAVTRPRGRGRGRARILERRVQADCKPGGMQDKVS